MSQLIPETTRDFLKALASETRQRILLEVFADGDERTVGQVAQLAGLVPSAASEQLSLMRRAGLLRSRRVGKEVLYAPDGQTLLLHLEHLQTLIGACCKQAR